MPPAVTIGPAGDRLGAGTDHDVDPGQISGLPALPMPLTPAVADADIGLDDHPQWSRITALVMTVSTAPSARVAWLWPMPSRNHLAAAEFDLLAVNRAVALDLDDELGVGEKRSLVAGRRAEHFGIGAA